MKLNLFCLLLVLSIFYGCGLKTNTQMQDMSFYDGLEKNHIEIFVNSQFINNIVSKLQGIDWDMIDIPLSKERAVYYLNEASKIKNHCGEKSDSTYVIEDLNIDYMKIRRIESRIVDSKHIYTYWIDNHLSIGKILEIREFQDNEFTVFCGFVID